MIGTTVAELAFWGAWLLIPILLDGAVAGSYLLAVVAGRAHRLPLRPISAAPNGKWPLVSVVVPVYNSESSLGRCIESIKAQSYPRELIELLAVDNGSRDDSFMAFAKQQQSNFTGAIHWLKTFHQGKPWALNVGVHHTRGQYVINLDSDVALHPEAIANMVAAFENDPDLVAVTGAIEIDPSARPRSWMRLLNECEFQEYYFSFNVGRRFQSAANSLFTLAGAFSGFRRDALLATHLYNTATVGEDTYLTFDLHECLPGEKVAVVPSAVCYAEPVPSLAALYAQRVRWQRGEIEVIAAHPQLVRRGLFHRGFSPARTLISDHTLAFPRAGWTFLTPALVLFGYSPQAILLAVALLYGAYVVIEAATWTTSALLVVPPSSGRLRRGWWVIPLMPAYRYLTFWMRFSGTLTVLTEPQQWNAANPVAASRRQAARIVERTRREKVTRAA